MALNVQEVLCGEREAACACVLPLGHDGAHECNCGGSWEADGEEFVVVAWPIMEGLYPRGRRDVWWRRRRGS